MTNDMPLAGSERGEYAGRGVVAGLVIADSTGVPHWFYIVFVFVMGSCIGSFLNVVVWRLPRGKSLLWPPSACPKCGHQLGARDNIPVFGWINRFR